MMMPILRILLEHINNNSTFPSIDSVVLSIPSSLLSTMHSAIQYTTLIVASVLISVKAFQPSSSIAQRNFNLNIQRTNSNLQALSDNDGDTTPSGDSYEGNIDWDAEWAKVVKDKETNKNTGSSRPGQDYYKNDAQRVAVKASKVASEQINKVKIVKPDINLKMLSGDARFWIAICEL